MKNLNIHDLGLLPLKQIIDQRGAIYHYLNAEESNFKGFGEAYYSKVNPGIVKGWKMHYEVYQYFCVPFGAIEIVIFDGRKDSPTYGALDKILLDDHLNYARLNIPPKLWYGFKCVSKEFGLLANIINQKHRPDESETLPLDTNLIPYEWR